MTKRHLPAHVYDKKGVLYFQRRGYKTTRIQSEAGTAAFALEYAALLNGALIPPAAPARTLSALVKDYLTSNRYKRLAPRTARDYEKVLAWVTAKLGHLQVGGIQRKDIIRARETNADKMRFANYIVQVVRILLQHAIDLGWRSDNPAKGVELLRSDAPAREAWPQDMIDAYRAEASGRALLIFELCLGTGQRIGDVLRMRWSDIDGEGIAIRQGKTKVKLWIPITPQLRVILEETPRIGLTICAYGPNGKQLSYSSASQDVRTVRDVIGALAYDIHGLRYAATAELAAAGCSDEVIAATTGHKTTAMIAKYAGPARQRARASEANAKRETNAARTENIEKNVESDE